MTLNDLLDETRRMTLVMSGFCAGLPIQYRMRVSLETFDNPHTPSEEEWKDISFPMWNWSFSDYRINPIRP